MPVVEWKGMAAGESEFCRQVTNLEFALEALRLGQYPYICSLAS